MKLASLALTLVMHAAPALAQPGGMGQGGGRFAIVNGNAFGWSLMTEDEHNAHRQQMRSFRSYDECKACQREHR